MKGALFVRQRLIYILKHNMVIQKLYKYAMSAVFRFLGFFVKTRDDELLFVSFMGSKFNDSPQMIYDNIKNSNCYGKYKCIWAFQNPLEHPQIPSVKIDTLHYFITALRAKYWVTNTNIERGLSFKKKDQIYLNTWHGVALKHIGNDCPGRKDYDFSTVNYLCVSGMHDEQVFRSAFNANPEIYLRCGMPRNDELWAADNVKKAQIRQSLRIPEGKKVILYAPTWRDSVDGGKTYSIKPPIDFSAWQALLSEEYILLFRAHHLTTKVLNVEFNDFIRDYSDYPAVNDLLILADLLITDYSAIAFDYSILGKPILTYAYDYDSYLKVRGTYFDMFELYPNKPCLTESELLERIQALDYAQECTNSLCFRDRFIQYGKAATEQCVSALFSSEHELDVVKQ